MKSHESSLNKRVIVAIDTVDNDTITLLFQKLRDQVSIVKLGLQTFTTFGRDIVNRACDSGFEVFLDLKFHDIPNTVEKAVESVIDLNVRFLTVHIIGGKEMLARAVAAAGKNPETSILGVTVLTSMDDNTMAELKYSEPINELVPRYAKYGQSAGVHGVVCSPLEIKDVRAACGSKFMIVTPGVRPVKRADDQKRVMTPRKAFESGADYIVIGRPVLEAPDLDAFFATLFV